LSWRLDECKPLVAGGGGGATGASDISNHGSLSSHSLDADAAAAAAASESRPQTPGPTLTDPDLEVLSREGAEAGGLIENKQAFEYISEHVIPSSLLLI
jgi:hypothetical protein